MRLRDFLVALALSITVGAISSATYVLYVGPALFT